MAVILADKIDYEGEEMVIIRFAKDLAESETLSKFLGHINMQSLLKKSRASISSQCMKRRNRMNNFPTGLVLLRDPALNKGTAFTDEKREAFGIRGLLPPRVYNIDEQVQQILWNLRRKTTDMERYIFQQVSTGYYFVLQASPGEYRRSDAYLYPDSGTSLSGMRADLRDITGDFYHRK